jgi:HSP20 family protein
MMTTRWNPLGEMQAEMNRLRNEMERLFRRGVANGRTLWAPAEHPAVNLWEDRDNYYVEAELPGLTLQDLEIYVNAGNQLTIKGERKEPALQAGSWHRQERGYGKFVKMMELPNPVDEDRVEARLKLGVLSLKLPKREEVKPRRIDVATE